MPQHTSFKRKRIGLVLCISKALLLGRDLLSSQARSPACIADCTCFLLFSRAKKKLKFPQDIDTSEKFPLFPRLAMLAVNSQSSCFADSLTEP